MRKAVPRTRRCRCRCRCPWGGRVFNKILRCDFGSFKNLSPKDTHSNNRLPMSWRGSMMRYKSKGLLMNRSNRDRVSCIRGNVHPLVFKRNRLCQSWEFSIKSSRFPWTNPGRKVIRFEPSWEKRLVGPLSQPSLLEANTLEALMPESLSRTLRASKSWPFKAPYDRPCTRPVSNFQVTSLDQVVESYSLHQEIVVDPTILGSFRAETLSLMHD